MLDELLSVTISFAFKDVHFDNNDSFLDSHDNFAVDDENFKLVMFSFDLIAYDNSFLRGFYLFIVLCAIYDQELFHDPFY